MKSNEVLRKKLLDLLEELPLGGTLEELVNGTHSGPEQMRKTLLPLIWAGEVEAKPYRHPANGKPTHLFKLRKRE